MKNKALIFILLLNIWFVSETPAQDFWEMMTPHKDVSSIAMNSEGHLYIGAKDTLTGHGGLYRSMDDGESWELLYHHMYDHRPFTIFCTEEYVFFNDQDRFLRMSEADMSVDTVIGGTVANFLCSGKGESGAIYAASEILFKSSNQGQTWDTLLTLSSTTEYFYDILEVSPDTIFASTVDWISGGGVYRSVDGGETWEWILENYGVTSLEQASNGDIFAAGYGLYDEDYGQVMISENGGDSWYMSLSMEYLQIQDMEIMPDDKMYLGSVGALSFNCGVYISNNYGVSWEHYITNVISESTKVHVIELLNDGHMYLCADRDELPWGIKNLYRSVEPLYTDISGIPQAQAAMEASPNPATQEVTFSFELPAKPAVLQVHNVNGQEMFRQRVTSGLQSVRVEVSSWPQGVYIARVLSKGLLQGAVKFVVR